MYRSMAYDDRKAAEAGRESCGRGGVGEGAGAAGAGFAPAFAAPAVIEDAIVWSRMGEFSIFDDIGVRLTNL